MSYSGLEITLAGNLQRAIEDASGSQAPDGDGSAGREMNDSAEEYMAQKKSWTAFSYPLHRLQYQYCYNLRPYVFSSIRSDYLSGWKRMDTGVPVKPKNTDPIRQDILATFLIVKYKLSHYAFITDKQLATNRNTRRSVPSVEEK